MRMKFLRILPDTWASTLCLFSSSTRNMALGSGSRTTAITSIASSLLIDSLKALGSWILALLRQNHRTVFRDCDAVFKMRTETAVDRHGRPLISEHSRFRLAVVHHGLDSEYHALSQLRAMTPGSEVRHLRLFVQPRADTVANKLSNYAEAVGLDMLLNRGSNVAHRVADAHLLNSAVKRFFRDRQQLAQFRLDRFDRNRNRSVSVVPIEHHAAIDGDDIAFLHRPLFRRNAMHDLFIHRGAQHAGIIVIPLKRRLSAKILDLLCRGTLQIHGGDAGSHHSPYMIENLAHDAAAFPHLLNLSRRFAHNRHA